MIFNLFKSKPTLRELIPKGFVDIHSHILPGIDDGVKSLKESIELISQMKKIGFSKIIGTPHTYPGIYDNTNESIKKSFDLLKSMKINNIELDYASEYMLENSLIKKAKNKNLLCIKDNFVLVEMSFIAAPINLYEIIYEINVNGYTPILAHPERYLFYEEKIEKFNKLKRAGCKFQLNLLSTVGFYGKKVANRSNFLLKNKMIDYVGSDFHNVNNIKQVSKKIKINSTKELVEAIEKNSNFI